MGHTPYYNQKVLRFVNRPKDKQHPYTMFNKEALKEAMLNLSASAFKLYIYIGSFKEMADTNETFSLSRQNTTKAIDISKNSYLAAVKELQSKGYIVIDQTKQDKDNYIFIEHPVHLPPDN